MIRLSAKLFALSLLAACSATIGQDPPGGGGGGGGGGAGGGGGGPDASCPDVHFMATKTTPYVELLLDRSGSMTGTDISPTRYGALHTALTGSGGAVTASQGDVYFGAALFAGDESPCPPSANLDGMSVPRALNNASVIDALISNNPPNGGSTPTADWITAVHNDFTAHPVPMGAAPIILLATDGEPNSCSNGNDNGQSVLAAKAAYAAGIRLFIVGLQPAGGTPLNPQFLQDMANAGAGVQTGQPNAPFYTSESPSQMTTAFQQIIGGVLSCDLQLSGTVDTSQASSGTVTLNGTPLQYGTDWTLVNGNTLELLGNACNTLKSSTNPTVDAAFSCGAVIQ